ncbi:hypothetical protein BGZ96_005233 [Linnemannia gamsii]|uniref:HCP-like protein n=1 Tax=Linnemannia gamsii TaxID=64522 RepID=A0ABQ7K4D4_9FUNG|nr:hypothetical protein BGZ96_005233 [Linnemannia gamsii]
MGDQFKEQERAYFEHLMAETGADNNWNVVCKGTQDDQELAEEELAAQPMAVDAEMEVLAVSPIDPSDLDDGFNYLDDRAGGYEPPSPDGLTIVRQTLQGDGPQDSLELRKLLKQGVRTSSMIKKAREKGNGDNMGYASGEDGEGDEGVRPDTPLFSRIYFPTNTDPMTIQETHPLVQAVRRVYETGQPTIPSNITHIACHPDSSSSGKDVILWDDIKAVFGDVAHIRAGSTVQSFLKGGDHKNLDPLRIAAVPGATLEVVVRGHPVRAEFSVLQETPNIAQLQKLSREAQQETITSTRHSKYSYIRNPVMARPRRTINTTTTEQLSTTISVPDTYQTLNATPPSPLQLAPEESIRGSKQDLISTMVTARSGCRYAQAGLGTMYLDGLTVSQDCVQAMDWFLKAAEQGSADAQCGIGFMYENGKGVPKDHYKAALWYAKASEQGQAYAQHNFGRMYRDGRGVTKDEAKAAELFLKAAEKGHADAQGNIGVAYDKGQGVPQDHAKAAEWYLKSAEQGSSASQHNLATLYQHGNGVEQDYGQSLVWYHKAAEQGSAAAMFAVGYNYHYGHGVTQDYTQAMEWYVKAADLGNPVAQYNIASMYDDGQGVPQDYEVAMDWFLKAAEQGLAAAQNSLGMMYQYGQGVLQDYSLAVEWYREAADQGHADGQFNLGNMYEDGEGVLADKAEAMKWFQKAADQGNTNATKRLAHLKRQA